MFNDPITFKEKVGAIVTEDSVVGIVAPEKLTFLYISAPWYEEESPMGEVVKKVAESRNAELLSYDCDSVDPVDLDGILQSKLPFRGIPHLFVVSPKNMFTSIAGVHTEEELNSILNKAKF